MALLSLSLFKQLAGISQSSTAGDAQHSALIQVAERAVKSFCGQNFEVATYTEYHKGNSQKALILKQRPVTSITSVHLDWSAAYGTGPTPFASDTLLTAGSDYALDLDSTWNGSAVSQSGLLIRIDYRWPEVYYSPAYGKLTPEIGESYGSIRVIYVAGYNPIPEDIQFATAFLVMAMKKDLPYGGSLESERIGDYSYKLRYPFPGEPVTLGQARQLLSKYRDIVL